MPRDCREGEGRCAGLAGLSCGLGLGRDVDLVCQDLELVSAALSRGGETNLRRTLRKYHRLGSRARRSSASTGGFRMTNDLYIHLWYIRFTHIRYATPRDLLRGA